MGQEGKKYMLFKGYIYSFRLLWIEGNLVHALPHLVIMPIISMSKEKQLKLLINMVGKQYFLNNKLIAMKKHTIEKVMLWVGLACS